MSIHGLSRTICLTAFLVFWSGISAAMPAGLSKRFRISAVQEDQVWIEGGLIDGLEQAYYLLDTAMDKLRKVKETPTCIS